MTTPSLRDRSKARRRRAIQLAAMRLFAERGYEGATIADIAEAAEVAPRTISMYFPTKLDLARSVPSDIADLLTTAFREHPELAFTEVVLHWLEAMIDSIDPELATGMVRMFDTNPGLRGASTQVAEAARLGGPALLAEIGLPEGDPMIPIITATVGTAITEYLAAAIRNPPTRDGHQRFVRYLRAVILAAPQKPNSRN